MLHTVVWLLAIGIAFFNLLQQPSIFQWGNPLAGYGWGCRPHGCEAAGLHWGWKSAANIPISVRTTTMAGRDLPRQYLISRRYLRCLVSSWNGKSVPKIFSYYCFFLVWISRQKKLAFNHGLNYKCWNEKGSFQSSWKSTQNNFSVIHNSYCWKLNDCRKCRSFIQNVQRIRKLKTTFWLEINLCQVMPNHSHVMNVM